MPERRYAFAVGVDGGKKTGLAVWHVADQAFTCVETTDFWGAYEDVLANLPPHETLIVIEDPDQNRPVFERGYAGRRQAKIAQNVGGVKRESRLLGEGFERAGYAVRYVRPSASKWDAALFKRASGLKGRTSQHARDAARLVLNHDGR